MGNCSMARASLLFKGFIVEHRGTLCLGTICQHAQTIVTNSYSFFVVTHETNTARCQGRGGRLYTITLPLDVFGTITRVPLLDSFRMTNGNQNWETVFSSWQVRLCMTIQINSYHRWCRVTLTYTTNPIVIIKIE